MKTEPIEKIEITSVKRVSKGWGEEIHIVNNEKYCGKILKFNKGSKFSMHYHWQKWETWYVVKGKLSLTTYDLTNSDKKTIIIETGTVVNIPAGNPHQLEAIEDSDIFEVSTTDYKIDSYRILPGDSQKNKND